MDDADLVAFLHWALPRLRLRWPGYRKVRGTVRSRLNRRLRDLGLPDLEEYRRHLDGHPGEWAGLGAICRIVTSRFYRDRAVFVDLRRTILLELARPVTGRGVAELRCWSAGCASGEEPYTLKALWELSLPPGLARVPPQIVATDADESVLGRARVGCYEAASVKDLPEDLRDLAFTREGDRFQDREDLREGIEFRREDLTEQMPPAPFHLIL